MPLLCQKCLKPNCEHLDLARSLNNLHVDFMKNKLVVCEQCNANVPKEDLDAHKRAWCDENFKRKAKSASLKSLSFDENAPSTQFHLRISKEALAALDYAAWKRRTSVNKLINYAVFSYLESIKTEAD